MREIKFRSWDAKDKLMREKIEGRYWLGLEIETGKLVGHQEGKLVDAPPGRIILMQYTGLKDRLGKEIYEGDILGAYVTNNFNSRERRIGVMEWKPEWAQFAFRITTDVPDNFDDGNPSTEPEIIGNIYENPELLTSPTSS